MSKEERATASLWMDRRNVAIGLTDMTDDQLLELIAQVYMPQSLTSTPPPLTSSSCPSLASSSCPSLTSSSPSLAFVPFHTNSYRNLSSFRSKS